MTRLWLAVVAMALCVSGCSLFSPNPEPTDNDNTPADSGVAGLKAFESQQEFEEYFSAQVEQRNTLYLEGADGGMLAPPAFSDEDDGATGDVAGAPSSPGTGAAGAPEDSSDSPDYSGTTVQETGVDEADVVKTDGAYVYVMQWDRVVIARVTPTDALGVVSTVSLPGYRRDMYLADGKVIALTETYGSYIYAGGGIAVDVGVSDAEGGASGGSAGDAAAPPPSDSGAEPAPGDDAEDDDGDSAIDPSLGYAYERPEVFVSIIDVADPADPQVLSTTSFDGSLSSSRMIDGRLHLVVANYPNYFYDVMPMLGRPEMSMAGMDAVTLLPEYERVLASGETSEGAVLTWRELYRPIDPDGFGIVTVVSMNADDASFSAVGVVADPGLIYSSVNALYLTDTAYDWFGGNRTTTDIYKFAYTDEGASPVAAGTVTGRVLNQYSMGEYQDHLCVATTIDRTWFPDGSTEESSNNVFVLADTEGELTIAGRIEGIAEGETIQSARFMGPRAYLVTFEQIDPLFTIDLSDLTDPRIVGELKVPGFSTYIAAIDDDHLLTVGQYVPEDGPAWPTAVQLSIFDVSDFANPVQTHNVILGEGDSAWSEATWNPKAFTYWAEQGLVALPISIYPAYGGGFVDDGVIEPDEPAQEDEAGEESDSPDGDDSSSSSSGGDGDDGTVSDDDVVEPDDGGDVYVPEGFDGLVVYRVSSADGFTELGRISTRMDVGSGYYYWPSFTRGVFIDSNVFAVTEYGLRGGSTDDLSETPYELVFGE